MKIRLGKFNYHKKNRQVILVFRVWPLNKNIALTSYNTATYCEVDMATTALENITQFNQTLRPQQALYRARGKRSPQTGLW